MRYPRIIRPEVSLDGLGGAQPALLVSGLLVCCEVSASAIESQKRALAICVRGVARFAVTSCVSNRRRSVPQRIKSRQFKWRPLMLYLQSQYSTDLDRHKDFTILAQYLQRDVLVFLFN